ncbi:MAG: glycosyltransferase family 39 protein [Deltaproteobacteria bacterium]|nr:glycosyltransferase family 39 protein [Deltaproteobacteria bacterium]
MPSSGEAKLPVVRAQSWRQRADRSLTQVLWFAALASICVLVAVALRRVSYPFELEWMEGAMVDHVRVVLSGEPLYHAPSIEHTPFLYTPLYHYLGAGLAKLFGVSFTLLRSISILATLASLALIGWIVLAETQSRLAAVVAAGLFAASYGLTGFWLDIARADSLCLALVLGAVATARFGESTRAHLATAVLLVLAFFTKQTALALAIGPLAYLVAKDWRRGLGAVAVFVVLLGGIVGWLDARSGGWFTFYVFEIGSSHPFLWDRWHQLWVDFFWNPVAVSALLAALAFVGPALWTKGRRVWAFYLLLCITSAGSAYLSLLHKDGFVNVLIPAYAMLSLVVGPGLSWVLAERERMDRVSGASVGLFTKLAILVGFALLAYQPQRALPTEQDEPACTAMIQVLRDQPGEILVLGTGYYGALAGHPEIHAHAMGLADVFKSDAQPVRAQLLDDLVRSLRSRRFAAVVSGRALSLLPPEIGTELGRSYRRERQLFPPDARAACWPKVGFANRPEQLWVARPQ